MLFTEIADLSNDARTHTVNTNEGGLAEARTVNRSRSNMYRLRIVYENKYNEYQQVRDA